MTILPHIKFAALSDLLEGRLDAKAQEEALTHISTCKRCAGQASELRKVIEAMRGDATESAPLPVRAAAVNLFRSRAIVREAPLRRVLAALKFDSLQPAFAMGLRAGAATERQLLFEAGESELHLQLGPVGNGWRIAGQVLGQCQAGTVELQGALGSAQAALSDLCEFDLPPQPEGVYALTLRLADLELVIEELTLGDPRA